MIAPYSTQCLLSRKNDSLRCVSLLDDHIASLCPMDMQTVSSTVHDFSLWPVTHVGCVLFLSPHVFSWRWLPFNKITTRFAKIVSTPHIPYSVSTTPIQPSIYSFTTGLSGEQRQSRFDQPPNNFGGMGGNAGGGMMNMGGARDLMRERMMERRDNRGGGREDFEQKRSRRF